MQFHVFCYYINYKLCTILQKFIVLPNIYFLSTSLIVHYDTLIKKLNFKYTQHHNWDNIINYPNQIMTKKN